MPFGRKVDPKRLMIPFMSLALVGNAMNAAASNAAVRAGFNGGNAVGSLVGGMALNALGMDYHVTGLAGLPFTVVAVLLLAAFAVRFKRRTAGNAVKASDGRKLHP